MSILITQVLPLTSTPGNVVPSDGAKMAANYAILSTLSEKDQKAIALIGLAAITQQNTAAINYITAAKHPLLIEDALTYTSGIRNFNLTTALAAQLINNGYTYSESLNVETLLAKAKILRQLPEETLDRIWAMLRSSVIQ